MKAQWKIHKKSLLRFDTIETQYAQRINNSNSASQAYNHAKYFNEVQR